MPGIKTQLLVISDILEEISLSPDPPKADLKETLYKLGKFAQEEEALQSRIANLMLEVGIHKEQLRLIQNRMAAMQGEILKNIEEV